MAQSPSDINNSHLSHLHIINHHTMSTNPYNDDHDAPPAYDTSAYAPVPMTSPAPPPPAPEAAYPSAPQGPMVALVLSRAPMRLVCPHCKFEGFTLLTHQANGLTYIWCCGLFLLTGVLCCIPFCVDSCQATTHHCASCKRVIAVVD
jgi:lipopolysaccharide-induced tumor necrosis factor-alpha factor